MTCQAVRVIGLVLQVVPTLLAASANAASPETATKADIQAATDLYERGIKAMDTSKFEDALENFRSSYDKVHSPNSQLMVARALVKLGKLREAYLELSRLVQDASGNPALTKRYKKTIESADKDLDDLKGQLAFVTLHEGAQIQIQGLAATPLSSQVPQPVAPGDVTLVVTFKDGQQTSQHISLKAGERYDYTIESPAKPALSPAPAPALTNRAPAPVSPADSTKNRRTAGYLCGALGVVGVGTFVGFGIVAASSFGDPKAGCSGQICSQDAYNHVRTKSLDQGIGYTGLGVGIIGLGVGTWLLFSNSGSSPPTTALRIGPTALSLQQQF